MENFHFRFAKDDKLSMENMTSCCKAIFNICGFILFWKLISCTKQNDLWMGIEYFSETIYSVSKLFLLYHTTKGKT